MKEQILKLRAEGKTYKEIHDILGCSKGTISYHCGAEQKQKYANRRKALAQGANYIAAKKIDFFVAKTNDHYPAYQKRGEDFDQYLNKVLSSTHCYLTGRKIDLTDGNSYQLDHIIPYHLSKDNSINNMGVACKDANQSKSHLTIEQYLAICKEVLEHYGYKVTNENEV